MRWPFTFFAARLKAPKPAFYRVVQGEFVDWNADDVANLRKFYVTYTGSKLVKICGSETLQQAMKEANGDALARAAGMDHMLRMQFNMASDKELARISAATAVPVAHSDDSQQEEAASSAIRSF